MTETNRAYAEALFMLAAEADCCASYSDALDFVLQAVRENPLYLDFLESPAIPLGERLAALDEAFGQNLPEHVVSFLKILCENGHIRTLFECVDEFKKLVAFASKSACATVYSAVELSNSQKASLTAKLESVTGKSIDLDCQLDPTLIGGVRIEVEGQIFDGSLKQRLREVKEVIN